MPGTAGSSDLTKARIQLRKKVRSFSESNTQISFGDTIRTIGKLFDGSLKSMQKRIEVCDVLSESEFQGLTIQTYRAALTGLTETEYTSDNWKHLMRSALTKHKTKENQTREANETLEVKIKQLGIPCGEIYQLFERAQSVEAIKNRIEVCDVLTGLPTNQRYGVRNEIGRSTLTNWRTNVEKYIKKVYGRRRLLRDLCKRANESELLL